MEACNRYSIKTWDSSIKTIGSFHRDHGFIPSRQENSSIKKYDFPHVQAVFRPPKRFKKGILKEIKGCLRCPLADHPFFQIAVHQYNVSSIQKNPAFREQFFSSGICLRKYSVPALDNLSCPCGSCDPDINLPPAEGKTCTTIPLIVSLWHGPHSFS